MVAVAYRRWSFTRGSNYKDLLENVWCFGLAVAYGRRSLTRGGRTWRFDCILDIEGDTHSVSVSIISLQGIAWYCNFDTRYSIIETSFIDRKNINTFRIHINSQSLDMAGNTGNVKGS